ncbi:hypothetical protein SADUNF_Sadunf02G0019700 [Salix dunnii]|uniref:Uncharacterized protein n=1 Tax=Salix dunnii TaxID=1413687 RepID=A0A835TFR9_9ROSI|nr:hypothetical protein SADUNF_Sadunf02G0019700 [Salix dunnii]
MATKQRSRERFAPPETSCCSHYSSHSYYSEAIADCIEFFSKSSQEGILDGHWRGREGLRLGAGASSDKVGDTDSVCMIADEGSPTGIISFELFGLVMSRLQISALGRGTKSSKGSP